MLSNPKINSALLNALLAKGTVSNDVRDYSKDPFFIKKAEEAKKKVDKIGFPKAFIEKK
jgi:hypothetical protein